MWLLRKVDVRSPITQEYFLRKGNDSWNWTEKAMLCINGQINLKKIYDWFWIHRIGICTKQVLSEWWFIALCFLYVRSINRLPKLNWSCAKKPTNFYFVSNNCSFAILIIKISNVAFFFFFFLINLFLIIEGKDISLI